MSTKVHAKHVSPQWDVSKHDHGRNEHLTAGMPKRISSAVGRHSSQLMRSGSSYNAIQDPSPSPASVSRCISPFQAASSSPPLKLTAASRSQRHSTRIPVSALADSRPVPGAAGGWFNSRTRVKSVPLPTLINPLLPTASRRHRQLSVAAPRFLPGGTKSARDCVCLNFPRASRQQPLDVMSVNQSERLRSKGIEVKEVRQLKRSAECVPHRLDRLYIMTGDPIKPRNRYGIDNEELQRLRSLSLSRNPQLYYGKGMSSQNRNFMSKTVDKMEQRLADTETEDSGEATTPHAENTREQSAPPEMESASARVSTEESDRLRAGEGESLPHDTETAKDNDQDKNSLKVEGKTSFIIASERKISAVDSSAVMSRLARKSIVRRGSKLQIAELTMLSDDEQKATSAAIFRQLCTDGSSEVSVIKLQKGLFPDATHDQLSDFYLVFDLNGDRAISLEEFQAVLALNDQLNGIRTVDPSQTVHFNLESLAHLVRIYKEMFEMVDDDGNGRLSMNELLVLLSAAFGLQVGGDHSLAQHIIHTIGKQENGCIEFTEFLNYIPFFLALHQRVCSDPFSLDVIQEARDTMRQRIDSTSSLT